MESVPPLTANLAAFIPWCLNNVKIAQICMDRLGLPRIASNRQSRGFPQFEGPTAESCGALYKATCEEVSELSEKYQTKKEIRDADIAYHLAQAHQLMEPFLSKYGETLWGPYTPHAITSEYPRRLKYAISADRERIKMYLYCWIIQRVVMKQPAERVYEALHIGQNVRPYPITSSSLRGRNNPIPRDATVSSPSGSAGNAGDSDADSSYVEHREKRATIPADSYQTPSLSGTENTLSHALTEVISETNDNCLRGVDETANNESRKRSMPIEVSSDGESVYDWSGHSKNRAINRRGFSTGTSSASDDKRCKTTSQESNMSMHSANRRTENTTEATEMSEVRPIGPARSSGHRARRTGQYHIPNSHTRRAEQGRRLVLAHETKQAELSSHLSETLPETDNASSITQAVNEASDSDDDSVQGHAEGPRVQTRSAGKAASSAVSPTSLLVPLQLTPQSPELENLRHRLASKLSDILSTGLDQPNIPLLTGTVELIDTISKRDHLREQELYKDNVSKYRGARTQWLLCLNGLIDFCKKTGFRGNPTTRAAFCAALPDDQVFAVCKLFVHPRSAIAEWRGEKNPIWTVDGLGKDVASVLFYSASWGNSMRLSVLETWMINFTRELIAWYE